MARPLQLLSLLSRLGSLSAVPTACAKSFRFASRDASKAWVAGDHVQKASRRASRDSRDWAEDELKMEGEEDEEEVEDKLQALFDEGKKKQKTLKYHILKRKMTPPGAPHRKLTWDAIEQIKYLKQEQPEEWTVERLAEGFSVSPDVILRVLKSKFTPAPQRKAQQDAKVMTELGQQALPSGAGPGKDRLRLTGSSTQAMLPAGSKDSAEVAVAGQTLMLKGKDSGALVSSRGRVPMLPSHLPADTNKHISVAMTATAEGNSSSSPSAPEEEEEEESWDGQVFTEEELEEFLVTPKPSPAVQVGNDFFDTEGNFLYRI
ncbi:neugrin [Genypterus blacodes]|uniref:neugrin n=1 Tax=Genypterus blacodes TaxID=154954 RepID=UPI003F758F61